MRTVFTNSIAVHLSIDGGWMTARFYDLPYTCTFENNDCYWDQDPQATFRWLKHSGSTPTPGTGPNKDHTGIPSKSLLRFVLVEGINWFL